MYNRNKVCFLATLLLLISATLPATTRKVLFIGNSYTFTNTMPAMLQSFAVAMGDTLIFDQSDPAGYTLAQHSVYAPTITKIFSRQWDIVVVQEQSQLPAFPPDEVDTEVYPYAHKIDSMIHANDTCTQTMFMMTWGHADGDPSNCAFYPVICTYDGMQARLRESYMQMALGNHAVVAPVGAAWKVVRDSFPALWLYQADSIHPIVPGSYLQTSVLYASIFHKTPIGCTYTDGLTTSDAYTLQRIAKKVTLDSLSQWQQYGHYPYAGFSRTTLLNTVTFTNSSQHTTTYNWSFGDGGHDTASNPVHTYAHGGVYTITLTATTNCFTETRKDTVHIGIPTGISNADQWNPDAINIAQNGNGNITFLLPGTQPYDMLEVYDSRGSMIRKYPLTGANVADHFIPGLYLYRAYSQNRTAICTGKLVVY